MDIRNGNIRIREILQNQNGRRIFQRVSPVSINSPIMGMIKNMTLNQVIQKARGRMSQREINDILEELKRA